MDHTTANANEQSTNTRWSLSDIANASSSPTRNSSIMDSKMFISATGRLMSDVGTSSLQFLRTKRRHGSTSHAKSSSSRGKCGLSVSGRVAIQLCFSGSQPISVGST